MPTFEGRGGYVYEELPDGGFKIIKSPKSAGGQVIAKGGQYWDLIKKEQDELAGFVDRADHKQNAGRETSARSGLADARSSAASAASKVDTSPMAMAMEKAKTSPGATTSGTNKPMTESDIRFKPSVDRTEISDGNWAGVGGKDRPMTPSEHKPAPPQIPQDKIDRMAREAGQADSKKPSLGELASNRPLGNASTEELASSGDIEKFAKKSEGDKWHKDEGEKQMDKLYPAGHHVEEDPEMKRRISSRSNINR